MDVPRPARCILFAALLLGLAAGTGCDEGGSSEDVAAAPEADARPELTAKALEGGEVALRSVEGPVLVNLWATWCAPCLAEMPELRTIRERWESEGLRMIGVATQGEEALDKLKTFRDEHEMPFDVWYAPNQEPLSTFDVSAIPATFVYDGKGRVVWSHDGPVEDEAFEELKGVVAELLE